MSNCDIEVVFHHGGKFMITGTFGYHGGETSTLIIDLDRWSFFEIMTILKEMGYRNVKELWYSLGGPVLEDRLELLSDDKGACNLINISRRDGQAHLFVVNFISQPEYLYTIEYHSQSELGENQGGEVEGCVVEGGEVPEVEVGEPEVPEVGVGEPEVPEVGVGQQEVPQVEVEDAEVEDGEHGEQGNANDADVDVVVEEHAELDGDAHGEQGEAADVDVVIEENAELDDDFLGEEGEDAAVEDGEGDADADEDNIDDGVGDAEEDDWLGGTTRECSTRKKHLQPRGIRDNEWESDICDSIYLSDDSDVETSRFGDFATFKEPISMKYHRWELGTYFAEKDDFIYAIRSYGVHNGRKLKLWKNEKRRVSVKCYGSQGKCPWYAYCGYRSTQHTWQLRKIVDRHTCTREFKIGVVTSKWLSGRLEKSMQTNPDMKMTNLHNKFCKRYNIVVSRATTSRAKAMATTNIEEELLRANPGSTVKINVEPNQDQTIFKRIYVCLKACKDNFGKYGGELLTAVGRDANDQMCPLAYAVVEVENKESWTFFLELLIEDLGGGGFCSRCTFMSDQQKGLLPALQSLLPDVDQRYCVRHIYSNFRKKFPGLNLRQLLWKAAVSTTPEACETVMRQMKEVNLDAFKYLVQIPPRQVHLSRRRPACDTLVNNISEGFNSVILDAREKPIISMLEQIRMYLMNRWTSNRENISKYEGIICPKIKKRLQKELEKTKYWIPRYEHFSFGLNSYVLFLTLFLYHLAVGQGCKYFRSPMRIIAEKYVVDVEKRECTCRKWTITGIPCCHALTTMRFLNMNPEEYLPLWFRTCTYEETYNPIIFPLNGPHLCQRTSTPDIQPPPKRVLPGRPRKKRRLESWEQRKDDTQIGQKGIPKKCSICRQVGHRRPNCPQANQQQPQEGTPLQQPVPDQEPTPHQEATLHPTQGSEITEQTQPDQTTPAI
ncbi:hypothetical protein V8G54_024957 [Vigna mungo]|uniref:SWIM-type domain-containing protein n=1 Tax=Vigna mungo TaxID=3915 RepID=A0AAQ3N7Q4_VIGMU